MKKILIIEDEQHLRENLECLMTDEGYQVVTAGRVPVSCG